MVSKVQWRLCEVSAAESQAFISFSGTWDNPGAKRDGNRMSSLVTVNIGSQKYYVKKYEERGKFLRRFMGRSRVRAEWENVQRLIQMGIPTVRLVAYGEETRFMGVRKGMLVTEEIVGVTDLAGLVERGATCFARSSWIDHVIDRLSGYVRAMHRQGFVHNDLKWRNILVDFGDDTEVYIIDCPAGRKLDGFLLTPLLRRGVIKDLACLDKVARQVLSRTQRLKFYLGYAGMHKLDFAHKKQIRKILAFFDGRE